MLPEGPSLNVVVENPTAIVPQPGPTNKDWTMMLRASFAGECTHLNILVHAKVVHLS